MKNLFKRFSCIFLMIITIFNIRVFSLTEENEEGLYNVKAKRDILVLMLAYENYIKEITVDNNGLIYLAMNSGKKILYDDKKQKCYDEKLENPDLQDMLEEPYPLEDITEVLNGNRDPGRIRVYSLLDEVYGHEENQIRKSLKSISTNYGTLMFNENNEAANSLKKSLDTIATITNGNQQIGGFMYPTRGTYNYRYIQGTGRLSAHSYGIAIDLNSSDSDYWKWASKEKGSKRIAIYPKEIVRAFEENGFVWGGKWAHFDILHFEYRPEFILKAKYFGHSTAIEEDKWYEGIPMNDITIELIDKINNSIN